MLKWKEIIIRFIAGPNIDNGQVVEINIVGIVCLFQPVATAWLSEI